MDADDQSQTRLTESDGRDWPLLVSGRSSSRFVSNRDGEIYVMDADGQSQTRDRPRPLGRVSLLVSGLSPLCSTTTAIMRFM